MKKNLSLKKTRARLGRNKVSKSWQPNRVNMFCRCGSWKAICKRYCTNIYIYLYMKKNLCRQFSWRIIYILYLIALPSIVLFKAVYLLTNLLYRYVLYVKCISLFLVIVRVRQGYIVICSHFISPYYTANLLWSLRAKKPKNLLCPVW